MTTATENPPKDTTKPEAATDPINPETGKSYKEELAEERRKRTEAEARVLASRTSTPPTRTPPEVSGDALAQAEWNRLLAEDPTGFQAAKFIASLAGEYHATRTLKSVRQSAKVIKTVKADLRKRFKDFGTYEEALDAELEDATGEITTEGVEKLFHSIRGRDLERLLEEERKKHTPPERVPTPARSTETAGASPGESPLTSEQSAEFSAGNFESEAVYRKHLKARQDQLKAKHGDQLVRLPMTLTERPVLKTT